MFNSKRKKQVSSASISGCYIYRKCKMWTWNHVSTCNVCVKSGRKEEWNDPAQAHDHGPQHFRFPIRPHFNHDSYMFLFISELRQLILAGQGRKKLINELIGLHTANTPLTSITVHCSAWQQQMATPTTPVLYWKLKSDATNSNFTI